jgi:hypothetical protein
VRRAGLLELAGELSNRRSEVKKLIMGALMLVATPAECAQRTPYERCLANGDQENNQHVDNCVRRYGNPAEKRKWFRSLAEDVCTEDTDYKSYKSRASREAALQRCIKKELRNPAQLCGGYLSIECDK